jgi:uncharacterized protein DUF1918
MQPTNSFLAGVGEWIVLEPRRPGQTRRAAQVLEILGALGHELYRARWEDGTVTLVCRDDDVVVGRGISSHRSGDAVDVQTPARQRSANGRRGR